MPEMTAMPILAAPTTAGAMQPARGGSGMDPSAQAGAVSGTTIALDANAAAAPAAASDSFAAVLGRYLVKEIGDAKLPTGSAPAKLAQAPVDAEPLPVAAKDSKTDDQPISGEDAMAAGIASLLPLLQSLQPATPINDGKPGDKLATRQDIAASSSGTLALASQLVPGEQRVGPESSAQAAQTGPAAAEADTPVVAAVTTEEPGAPIHQKQGENKGAQAPVALPAGTGTAVGKAAAANPAAASLAVETSPAHTKPPEVPEGSFANALASAQAPVSVQVHSTRAPLNVEAPVGSGNWETQVGEKLVWMVGHHEQRADLTLNPPQMGKVEVSIALNGDQASAQFVSANPAVRDALEAAMPRLREMFADAGITLGQAQVGSDSAQNAAGNPANNRENSDNQRRGAGEAGPTGVLASVASPWLRSGTGMVDVFA